MQDTISTFPNQPVVGRKKNPLPIIIVLVVVALVVGVFFYFHQSKKNNQPQITATPTQEPTPTEKPQIDKQSVKIQVLNGTGTPGQAGKAVGALKSAGFNADNIKTDNAADNNHSVTTITAKAGYEDIASGIKIALNSLFDNINIDSSPLGSNSQFDIVVTTGGKKYETPTPVGATPSATLTPNPTNTPIPSPTVTSTPKP